MPDNINYNSGSIVTYFARLDAPVQGSQTQLSDVTAPGADGVAFRREAVRAEPFEGLSEVFVTSLANAVAVRDVYGTLTAKLVTLTVQGGAYTNILVLNPVIVEPFVPIARGIFVILPDGNTTTANDLYMVRARWKFIFGGAP